MNAPAPAPRLRPGAGAGVGPGEIREFCSVDDAGHSLLRAARTSRPSAEALGHTSQETTARYIALVKPAQRKTLQEHAL